MSLEYFFHAVSVDYYSHCLICMDVCPGFYCSLFCQLSLCILSRGSPNKEEEMCLPVGCLRWWRLNQSWTLSSKHCQCKTLHSYVRVATPYISVMYSKNKWFHYLLSEYTALWWTNSISAIIQLLSLYCSIINLTRERNEYWNRCINHPLFIWLQKQT